VGHKRIVSRFDRRMAFVPGGRSKSLIGSIVPLGRGYSHDSRHFVPGYYRAIPPGQKPSPIEVPRIILALMG
jgi:hypothetical protein